MDLESGEQELQDIASQVTLSGQVLPAADLVKSIDAVTVADVTNVSGACKLYAREILRLLNDGDAITNKFKFDLPSL